MSVPSLCGGVERRALQRRRETHVFGFHGRVGVQLLPLVVGAHLHRCTLGELPHGGREDWD